MADSKPTDVHRLARYLGLDTWYMQNIEIMWFDICKANVFEIFVNWSQPKTVGRFFKKTKAML